MLRCSGNNNPSSTGYSTSSETISVTVRFVEDSDEVRVDSLTSQVLDHSDSTRSGDASARLRPDSRPLKPGGPCNRGLWQTPVAPVSVEWPVSRPQVFHDKNSIAGAVANSRALSDSIPLGNMMINLA